MVWAEAAGHADQDVAYAPAKMLSVPFTGRSSLRERPAPFVRFLQIFAFTSRFAITLLL